MRNIISPTAGEQNTATIVSQREVFMTGHVTRTGCRCTLRGSAVRALAIAALCACGLSAQTIEYITPITDSILALYITEGEWTYKSDKYFIVEDVSKEALNTDKAQNTSTYTITSSADSDYASGVQPLTVGRKSKVWVTSYMNDHLLRHWIYLVLPKPLERGTQYTLSMASGLVSSGDTETFTFNEFSMFSEAVKVNQVGYAPESRAKYAYVSQWMGDLRGLEMDHYTGVPFHVVDVSSGETKYSGTLVKSRDFQTGGPETYQGEPNQKHDISNNATFAHARDFAFADVYLCDFSAFTTPGTYKIVVERVGASFPFEIRANAYEDAFKATMYALYTQRCGIPVTLGDYTRDACHTREEYSDGWYRTTGTHDHSRKDRLDLKYDETCDAFGGYHDAADWDSYESHVTIPSILLTSYELAPKKFTDGQLDIPESSNGVADILDEAAWDLDWRRRVQKADGGIPEGKCMAGDKHTLAGSPNDNNLYLVIDPNEVSTHAYAGVAAQLVCMMDKAGVTEITGPYYDGLTRDALAASAKKAYDWAYAKANAEGTYGSSKSSIGRWLGQVHIYANAWMYRMTGEKVYEDRFKELNWVKNDTMFYHPLEDGPNCGPAMFAYAMADNPGRDVEYQNMIKRATVNGVHFDYLHPYVRNRGYKRSSHYRMPVIIGEPTSPMLMNLGVAYWLTQDAEILNWMYSTADYHLGANPMNMCWVAKMGSRWPDADVVMHNDSWVLHNNDLVKGMVPYGCLGARFQVGENAFEVFGNQFAPANSYPYKDPATRKYIIPPHESFFGNRAETMMAEWTVHQTLNNAASSYALLCPGDFGADPNPLSYTAVSAPKRLARRRPCLLGPTAPSGSTEDKRHWCA